MNNHFGQSRIFGRRVYCKVPAEAESDGFEGGNDLGGGSPETTQDISSEDGKSDDTDVAALKAELAKAKADALRFKNSNDKLLKEKGELTKKNREMMSADQLAQEAQKER